MMFGRAISYVLNIMTAAELGWPTFLKPWGSWPTLLRT